MKPLEFIEKMYPIAFFLVVGIQYNTLAYWVAYLVYLIAVVINHSPTHKS